MGLEAELADQEHKKAEAARAAAANERARIARDRHDVIAPAMSVRIIQVLGARGRGSIADDHGIPYLRVSDDQVIPYPLDQRFP